MPLHTLNKFISIHYTRNPLWANGNLAEHYAGEVTGSSPMEASLLTKLLTNHRVPCGEILLGQHTFRTDTCSLWIGPYNWMGWHVICPYMPHVILSLVHTHAMSSCLYCTDSMCHLASGATWHLFLPILPVDLIEQNAITFSYGVRLRWNECHWNHLDKPFDLELVLLILEDFKKFSFLDPLGSFLPTKKLLASKILY